MSLGWPVAFAAVTAAAAVGAGHSDSASHAPSVSLTVQSPAAQQSPQPPEQFQAESIYVRVQVHVLDKHGQFVRDLHRSDFDVLDEGVSQRLDSFVVVLAPDISGDATVLHQASSATPDARDVVRADTRRVVLLLDDLHVASRRSIVVKRLIADFITTRLGATDRVALVTTSGLEPQVEFSVDHARLLEALQHFNGQKLASATLQRMGGNGVPGDDPEDAEVRQRALNARRLLSTIQHVANRLGSVATQPADIVLVSEGPDYDTSRVLGNSPSDANDVIAAFREAVRTCSDLGIPVHTVDPRGLVLPEGDAVEVQGEFHAGMDFGLLNENSLSLRALRNLAKFTGGTAIVEQNDMAAGLARVAQQMGSYYLLGFYPGAPGRTRFHRLKVKVQRPGVRVVARDGYLMK